MAPCRKKLMLFHTSPFMIFLTMCRNNFCTLFIVFYVTKIKTKMSQAGNNWVHVGTRALKRRHNWLRPVPTERFPQEEDDIGPNSKGWKKGRNSLWIQKSEMRWLDSITDQWTPVWANSGSWLWTGKPGMKQSRGLQRVRHDSVAEQRHKRVKLMQFPRANDCFSRSTPKAEFSYSWWE